MIEIAIGLIRLQDWFDGDFRQVIELVRIADAEGVDLVTMTDHLAYTASIANYPHGAFDFNVDTPCFEPIASLAAMAAVTQRIRLSTGVLIAPLRPALLLAKQLATLDAISHGRVEIGVGAGWQREEFEACNIPFEGRFGHLMEQIGAMKTLWTQAPATYHGASVNLQGLHSRPFPQRPGGIPVYLGINASERNIERIARQADGWLPVEHDAGALKPAIAKILARRQELGLGDAPFTVRVMPVGTSSTALAMARSSGGLRLDEVAKSLPAFIDAGVRQFEFHPTVWCQGPADFPAFLRQLVALKESFR